jgi:DNA-binding IclR family transcriptional regulator
MECLTAFLRLNPNTWHSISNIAKTTKLPEATVKFALTTLRRHPLIAEKDQACGYFTLLK